MINIKFDNKKFKIYANIRIECLEPCEDITYQHLEDIVEMIMQSYHNPSDGFPVSFLANKLYEFNIEVINYKDYEMENAPADMIY